MVFKAGFTALIAMYVSVQITVYREHDVAAEHYEKRLLLQALVAWRSEVRCAAAQRKQSEEQEEHRKKMDALLRLAATKAAPPPPPLGSSPRIEPQNKHYSRGSPHKAHRTRGGSDKGSSPVSRPLPAVSRPPRTPEPAVWQVAKQQLVRVYGNGHIGGVSFSFIGTSE